MQIKKPAYFNLQFVPYKDWSKAYRTKEQWQRYIDAEAKTASKGKAFQWVGVVTDCGDYFRLSLTGQKED